ncbi:MAG: hypothetical protein ACK2UY_16490 [Anaerolineae bacterium]|jgi:hypothetical protein
MSEQDIDLSEIPEISEAQIKRATRRVGGKPATEDDIRDHIDPPAVSHKEMQDGSTVDNAEM